MPQKWGTSPGRSDRKEQIKMDWGWVRISHGLGCEHGTNCFECKFEDGCHMVEPSTNSRKLINHQCGQCGEIFETLTPHPLRCPHCMSSYWNQPKEMVVAL